MAGYWLRNTTKYDVSIGDLRYRIPAGQSRNLLAKSARLKVDDIRRSIKEGSLFKRLKSGALREVKYDVILAPPPKTTASSDTIIIARKAKVIPTKPSDLEDRLDSIILQEEDEILKELSEEDLMNNMGTAPIVSKEKKDGTTT